MRYIYGMADDERSWVDKAIDQMTELTPKSGYNVVAVDDFELPGEALYLVAHFDDLDEAEAARAAHEARSGDKTYIYVPDSE